MAKRASKVAVSKGKKTSGKEVASTQESRFADMVHALRDDFDRTMRSLTHGFVAPPLLSRAFRDFDPFREFPMSFDTMPITMTPRADIGETDKAYEIKLDLPGLDEKDIEITVADNRLTIKAEKKTEDEKKSESYHRRERAYGVMRRSFALPPDVDESGIAAELKQGVMKITLPKSAQAKAKARKVNVKSG